MFKKIIIKVVSDRIYSVIYVTSYLLHDGRLFLAVAAIWFKPKNDLLHGHWVMAT
jgi:hypothetical protein